MKTLILGVLALCVFTATTVYANHEKLGDANCVQECKSGAHLTFYKCRDNANRLSDYNATKLIKACGERDTHMQQIRM